MTDVTYDPIDVLKPVAPDIWIVDSGPMHIMGAPIPIRMTVIRTGDGSLLLHSPSPFRFELKAALDREGPVRHLVAPNTVHWSFVGEWQSHLPDATVWAAPGLRARPAVKQSGLRIDRDLEDGAPELWGGVLQTVVVPGAGISEVAFFHRPSRTLVLTDLVVNVEAEKLPALLAVGAKLVGAAAPDGKAPAYARLAFKAGGDAAREAAQRLLALEPERVIFSHGAWFQTDGTAQLRQSLRWLLD